MALVFTVILMILSSIFLDALPKPTNSKKFMECIADINNWMTSNLFLLKKTEILIIGQKKLPHVIV